MKKEIDRVTKKIEELRSQVKLYEAFLASARLICEHEWVHDYTCGHKGEDHHKCTICGSTD